MKTKILVALILVVILVIVVIWKRWMCMKCGCDIRKYTFDRVPKDDNCKCECKVPDFNPPICHTKARYWLSGGDADSLAVSDVNARDLLTLILTFVTWNTITDGVHKFLWVESKSVPSPGHVSSVTSLPLLGLFAGINYDHVDGTEFATTNLNNYTAICVASTSSGNLTSTELNALTSRSLDILNFTKQGGSIAVFAGLESNSYDWLPISITVSQVAHNSGFTATAIGSNFGLTLPTMEYPHSLIFSSYPSTILTPAERNNSDVTSLISSDTTIKNVCIDKKIDIPDTSQLCN